MYYSTLTCRIHCVLFYLAIRLGSLVVTPLSRFDVVINLFLYIRCADIKQVAYALAAGNVSVQQKSQSVLSYSVFHFHYNQQN